MSRSYSSLWLVDQKRAIDLGDGLNHIGPELALDWLNHTGTRPGATTLPLKRPSGDCRPITILIGMSESESEAEGSELTK